MSVTAFARAVLLYAHRHLDEESEDEVLTSTALLACAREYQVLVEAFTRDLHRQDRAGAVAELETAMRGVTMAAIACLREMSKGWA